MRMRLLPLVLAALGLAAPCLPAEAPAKTEKEYFAVFIDQAKVGHAFRSRKLQAGKDTTIERLKLKLRRGPVAITVETMSQSEETPDAKPLAFLFVQNMGSRQSAVSGKILDGKLQCQMSSAAGNRQLTVDWPQGALMPEGLRLLQRAKGLDEGTTYATKLFMAESLKAVDVEVKVGKTGSVDLLGRVVPLTRVDVAMSTPMGTMTAVNYVDDDFRSRKTVIPMAGMVVALVACDQRYALSKDSPPDFVAKTMLQSPVPLSAEQKAGPLVYRIKRKPGGKLNIPGGDNQTVQAADGGLLVTVRPVTPPAGASFPYDGSDKTALAAMKPSRFVESDDRKVAALANKAVGKTTDVAKAARKLEAFVARYVRSKNLSVGYATAAEVARSRQGDCTEHAVLLAAMCRAKGIPAQVVFGLTHVDRFLGKRNVFGGHAWVRAYIGGKWVHLDATMGYDAGHIMLATGDGSPDEFFGLLGTLGYFEMTDITPAGIR